MIKIVHKPGYFKHVTTTKENYLLTSWKEGQDIKDFMSTDYIYIPEIWTDDQIRSTYREISKEDADKYLELQIAAFEEDQRKQRELMER